MAYSKISNRALAMAGTGFAAVCGFALMPQAASAVECSNSGATATAANDGGNGSNTACGNVATATGTGSANTAIGGFSIAIGTDSFDGCGTVGGCGRRPLSLAWFGVRGAYM